MTPTSRIALVTGANKGIGLAVVRNLALQYPASTFSSNGTVPLLVYLTARDQGRAETAIQTLQSDPQLQKAKALAQDGGLSTIKYKHLDISNDESIKAIADFIKQEHPDGIDILINNAGIAMNGFDSNVVKTTLKTNYHNTILSTRTFVPLMRPDGRIVNVASIAGTLGSKYSSQIRNQFLASKTVEDVTKLMDTYAAAVDAGTHSQDGWPSAAYSVSKAGVIGATRAIAAEPQTKERGVLVNSCCPGWVVTDMTKGRGAKNVDQGAQTPVMLGLADLGGRSGDFWSDERVAAW